ncbi:hypothetical protein ACIQWB_38010 [Streptomyces olivaceus]|uniref:hypothetical protein n=1 Tax=Streptomyces olivaceus TaxID=47716 RepID=UPI00380F3431
MSLDSPGPTDPALGRPCTVLSRAEVTTAIDRLLRSTSRLRRLAADRYPLYAVDGHWTFSRRGSWTPGFWAGLLRLTARITADRTDRQLANEVSARLADRLDDDTVTRSMTFWYGAGTDRPDLSLRAARRLLATASPRQLLIPVGTAWGRAESGRREIEVDCWGPLIRLLSWAAPELGPAAGRIVAAHTRAWLHGSITATAPVAIVERLTTITMPPGPASRPTSSPRPAAWALLGLAESATALSGIDLRLATDCARTAVHLHRPLSCDGTSADTSADAIGAVALHKLPTCNTAAKAVTARLVRHHLRPDGAFPGTHYRVSGPPDDPAPDAARVESVWALFFLLLALAIDIELIGPDEF